MTKPPNLAETHEQYPDGFPARVDDSLLGHWVTPKGAVVVVDHPHGYEVHFQPCLDCHACRSDQFRECANRGPIVTVVGGSVGYDAVLRYLAMEGSSLHVHELAEREEKAREADRALREQERLEDEELRSEERHVTQPSIAERIAALGAELAALREETS